MKFPSLFSNSPTGTTDSFVATARDSSRRGFLFGCIGSLTALSVAALLPLRALAESAAANFSIAGSLEADNLDAAISEYTNGAKATVSDRLSIKAPQIAENGNVVPIELDATEVSGQVDQLAFFVANNPRPLNSVYHFSNADAFVSFRVKMLESSQVVAVARLKSGEYVRNNADIKVTVGGCGG